MDIQHLNKNSTQVLIRKSVWSMEDDACSFNNVFRIYKLRNYLVTVTQKHAKTKARIGELMSLYAC